MIRFDVKSQIKPTLVVTGSRGFIGMNFVKELLLRFEYTEEKCSEVLPFSGIVFVDAGMLKGGKHFEWMAQENFTIYTDVQKLCDRFSIPFTMVDIDINNTQFEIEGRLGMYVVVNFASESHVDNSINDPFSVFKDNACLVPNLIGALGIENIEKFVHIRTDEEFGHLTSVEEEPFKIDQELAPRNPYAASKASQTLFLKSLEETFNLNVKYITLANQFGLYQHESKMIPATIKRIVEGQNAKVYGDGSQIREWTFVEDTCKQIINFVLQENSERFLHISNPEGLITNLELVNKIINILKEQGYEGGIDFVEDRKGHDFCYKLESQKYVYNELDEDLKTTVEFFVKHFKDED